MIAYVAVGVGGAVGAMMRYGISQIGASQWPNLAFPLATLLVNWVGCLLMGMLMLGMERAHIAPQWYPLIGAGLLVLPPSLLLHWRACSSGNAVCLGWQWRILRFR
jgi:fluoride ion exporter CrcB/FEX